jgi:hypothetical protein
MAAVIAMGAASLAIAGEVRSLRFDWLALAALRERYGADFYERVNEILLGVELREMAYLIEAGCGLPADEVMRASPPVIPAAQAISRALHVAFHGDEMPKAEAGPLAKAAKMIAGVMDRAKAATLSAKASPHGSKSAGIGMSSGDELPTSRSFY